METETLHQGRLAVTNPMDDTHKTFKHLKKAGITEAQAEVFTETFKGLADQTMQVNENLLMVRDELREDITAVRGEITGIRGELKDIHHNAASNYQRLDAKIDKNQMKLEADLASTNQEVKHTRETLSNTIESTRETLSNAIVNTRETLLNQMDAKFAQAQNSMMRWNIGLFIGLAGLMIALIRPWE